MAESEMGIPFVIDNKQVRGDAQQVGSILGELSGMGFFSDFVIRRHWWFLIRNLAAVSYFGTRRVIEQAKKQRNRP
jgi:hypothetical protein